MSAGSEDDEPSQSTLALDDDAEAAALEAAAEESTETNNSESGGNQEEEEEEEDDEESARKREEIKRLEARAVAQAAASANAAYEPSQSMLNNPSPQALLDQIDGPSLGSYNTAENVYQAKKVPVVLRGKLDVPIHVSIGGSVVEYIVETETYDVSFGVTAEREDGEVVVRDLARVDSHLGPVTGKFLVGSVPCALLFTFDNSYSWFREKSVTYKIVVTPPAIENVIEGRRSRAQAALKTVKEDKTSAEGRLGTATTQRTTLQDSINKLEKELAEKKKSFDVIEKEEKWLQSRVELRGSQIEALDTRLENGWEDEKDIKEGSADKKYINEEGKNEF